MRRLAIVVLVGCRGALPATPPTSTPPSTPAPPDDTPLIGRRAPDVDSLLPRGYVATGDYFIEKLDDVGCLFVSTPGKPDANKRVVLYHRTGWGTDNVEYIIDDVIEVPAAIRADQLTSACDDGKPTIAILSWADHCLGMPARAQRAWRIVHGKLEAETAPVPCMRICDSDHP